MTRQSAAEAPLPVGTLKTRPGHLSFSQITRLAQRYDRSCPRSWAYEKLLGLPFTVGKGMILGSALDTAVQAYFGRRICGDPHPSAHIDGLEALQRAMDSAADWPAGLDRQDYTIMLAGAFTTFCEEYVLPRGIVPVAVQRPHEFSIRVPDGEQRVIGFSDWIESDGCIVDLKFSGSTHWTKDGDWHGDWLARVHDQLTTYYMGRLSDERRGAPDNLAPVAPKGRVVVVVASANRVSPIVKWHDFDLSDLDVTALADAAREADAVARSERHPARPGLACQLCSYVDRCRTDSARLAVRTQELAS